MIVRLFAHEGLVDQLVERPAPDVERAGHLGGELPPQHLFVAPLEIRGRHVELATGDRLVVHARDDVHTLSADRTDPPNDEEERQEPVEDFDADGAGVLAEKPKHSRACARG
jgi:hypothetical protein